MLAAQYVAGTGIEVAEVAAPPPGQARCSWRWPTSGSAAPTCTSWLGHMDDRVPTTA